MSGAGAVAVRSPPLGSSSTAVPTTRMWAVGAGGGTTSATPHPRGGEEDHDEGRGPRGPPARPSSPSSNPIHRQEEFIW